MRRSVFILTVLLLICSVAYAAMSTDSSRLEKLRRAIETQPTKENEQRYLKNFPSTFNKFKMVFYGNNLDELYPVHEEHLQLLANLYQKYPEQVKSIWFGVATNGSWDADALGILQHQIATYCAENTKQFAKDIQSKQAKARRSIIKFLADVENHDAYEEYKTIMKNLQVSGFKELYKEFELAKKRRMNENDH
jgi:hypothetical protein